MFLLLDEAAHQFERWSIAEEKGAQVHVPIRAPTDQCMQPRAICSKRPQVASANGEATPQSLVQTEEGRLQPLTEIMPASQPASRGAVHGLANRRSYCSSSDARAPSTPRLIVRFTPSRFCSSFSNCRISRSASM